MTLAEYLYVDETRLESYFEQISSPVLFEKRPTWKVGLSLTGPVAEGTQSNFPRAYTQHEKICTVLDYLQQSSQLRNPEQSSAATFVFESLDASPVHIPLTKDGPLDQGYLNLWVGSPKSGGGGFRFLLERFSGDDDERPAILSGFSCLRAMLDEFGDILRDFLLTHIQDVEEDEIKKLTNVSWDAFNRIRPMSYAAPKLISAELDRAGIPHASLPVIIDCWDGGDKKYWVFAVGEKRYSLRMTPAELIVERKQLDEFSALLNSEPLLLFAHWGARIGDQRAIDALYRVRRGGKDFALLPHLRNVTVVGYPIFLTSHPSPFTDKYIS